MEHTAIIIDGNSLLHRAFYALPSTMKKKDGTPTNAIYGFFAMLFHATEEFAPDRLAVAFDRKEKTFRHKLFADYKGGRRKTPDELIVQFPILKKALCDLGIPCLELEGYEADDILGTLAAQGDKAEIATYLITGDRDALQLISPQTRVVITKKGVTETEVFDEAHLREVYGIAPMQITDLKGLMGDASDNIPGVAGVGEKTATKLLSQFHSVEDLYAHIEALPQNKLKEKLIAGRDSALLSKTLATIDRNVPIETGIADIAFSGFAQGALKAVLTELQFTSLLKRFDLKETPHAAVEQIVETREALDALALRRENFAAIFLDEQGLSVCFDSKEEYNIPFSTSLFGEGISREAALFALKRLLEDENVRKAVHGAKAMMHACAEAGCALNGVDFDVEIAAYVLDPTRRNYSLEKLADYYAAAGRACAVLTICGVQKQEIAQNKLERVFYEIEMPLVRVLFDMEMRGFRVDVQRLMALQAEYAKRIDGLTQKIYELADCGEFNIASPKQLGAVLFEHLGLPVKKKKKTGYSTDIEVLESLSDLHPVINAIIEYRQVTKLKYTYIDGLLAVAGEDGKIHTTFNQTATATGRISSIEPNLQNIPIRSDVAKEIREVFLPSEEGRMIVSADYSQIELRVLAHIADDFHMKDAFLHDEDIHLRTAAEVFGVPKSEVTPQQRSSAKAVNFGIVYGISDFGLAKQLGIPRFMAANYIARYLEEFEGVRRYMHETVENAKREGCVHTLFGRVRYLDELKAANYNTRSFGERAAMNTPIQGTAADIIKVAMIRTHRALKESGMRSSLILQVHDELIVDAVPEEYEQVKELLLRAMGEACALSVPLKVNIAGGANWAEAK